MPSGTVKKIILHTQATDISDALSLVLALWGTKFAPIATPDDDREDLVGVRLIQIQERRLAPG